MKEPQKPVTPASPTREDLDREKAQGEEAPRREEFFMDIPRAGARERERRKRP